MPRRPRDLSKVTVSPSLAAFPVFHEKGWLQSGTTTVTIPLFRLTNKERLLAATFVQDNDTDGDKVIKIRNLTRSVDLTANLDVDALAADSGADFVLVTVESDLIGNVGDIIGAVYTVTTAGTVQPGELNVLTKWNLVK